MIARSVLSLALLGFALSAATAADLAVAPSPAVPAAATPFTWSGVYFGAQAGYGWGRTGYDFGSAAPSGTSDLGGPVGGVFGGYNAQLGSVVLGVEGDIGLADVIGSYGTDRANGSAGSARVEWDAALRARFGAAFGRSLIYAAGGVAFAGYEFKGGPNSERICCGFSDTLTGWTIGAGVEHAVTSHLITRLEYRYSDYGAASGALKPAYPGVTMRTTNTTSVVRAGVAYKF